MTVSAQWSVEEKEQMTVYLGFSTIGNQKGFHSAQRNQAYDLMKPSRDGNETLNLLWNTGTFYY